MEEIKKVDFIGTLKEGCQVGITNFLPLLLTTILFVITCWIPYLNVGTTVGFYRIILALSKDQKVDPFSLFNKENFSQIGDVFLLMGLKSIGCTAAALFMLIPAIVISIAWNYSLLILIDTKETPTKALSLSYQYTFGNKWRIFFIYFVFALLVSIVCALLSLIPYVGVVLTAIVIILTAAFYIGLEACIFKQINR